jgi:spore coat polysaccharide biosynthesis predicted glycosyltransferase SpsG
MTSLLVIAECGPGIGLGHVMRTLAVAEAARNAGWDATLVSPELPPNVDARLKAAGIRRGAPGMPLPPADALLVDGYGFGPDLLASWRGGTGCLAVMDDNGEHRGAPADMVINPNPHADAAAYGGWTGPEFRLGSAYAPLRREFRRQAPARADARHILVTMGGSDPLQLTGHIINSLQAIEEPLEITAVLGGMAAEPDVRPSRHAVTLLRDVAEMSAVMRRAGMAISAAGSSLWELAHLGVPTVALTVAENQVAAARAAAGLGMLVLATRQTVAAETRRLLEDEALRNALATAGRERVDGRGAERILEAMAQFHRP